MNLESHTFNGTVPESDLAARNVEAILFAGVPDSDLAALRRRNIAPPEAPKRTKCRYCPTTFVSLIPAHPRIICGARPCVAAYGRDHHAKRAPKRYCIICETQIKVKGTGPTKFCSEECRIENSRRYQKARNVRRRGTYKPKEKPVTHLDRAILKQLNKKQNGRNRKQSPDPVARSLGVEPKQKTSQEYKREENDRVHNWPSAPKSKPEKAVAVWRSIPTPQKSPLSRISPPITTNPPKSPRELMEGLKTRGIAIDIRIENEGGRMVPRFHATGGAMIDRDWVALRRFERGVREILGTQR